ncbi:TIGR02677 family protein [Clostridium sp.]|uniref:TIGR02677 family protein n=1 Tax=Clostridium sp. TaxID=1506 RepID=UPI00260F48FE|nr:TIGR02677 family protein [Clostridium sp.]
MKINRNIIKNIDETKYLSTENTWRYRAISRIVYESYEKMKLWLYKEDIFEELKKYEEFEEYTIDMLKGDLDALVNWRNLIAIADTSKVNTIEEFKNREFTYQLSEVAIEIERLLISLEHMKVENTATLEASLVERFKNLLYDCKMVLKENEKTTYEWWKELNTSFKELNRNYQDYISKFYSPKNDELMKTTEFLIFKEGFIKYLREFVKNLQTNTFEIREVFKDITDEEIESIINKVFFYEKSIQSLELLIDEREYKELNKGRINSMKDWFMQRNGRDALVDQLIANTNEVIRKITRYAVQIADKKNNNANRKEEYRNIAKIFNSLEDINEAHKLSAAVFGTFNIIKILGNEKRETESINSSIYDETPKKCIIKPRERSFREKIIKNPIADKGNKKEERLKKVLEKRKNEEDRIKTLLKDNVIDFAELKEIKSKDRMLLLKLLSKGMSKKQSFHKSDFGMEYVIDFSDAHETISLDCSDGILKMPHYKLVFREVK